MSGPFSVLATGW